MIRGALAFVMLTAPVAAVAQTRTPETVLMSPNERGRAAQEQYGFADAVIAGDTIYLSGIVAGLAPGETDMKPAFERVFRQIERILARAGAGLGDIVEMTSYHTDIVPQVDAMSEVQKRLLGSPPPAWTAVQVVRLLPEQGITEIKIVARRPDAARTNDAHRSSGASTDPARRPAPAAAAPGRN